MLVGLAASALLAVASAKPQMQVPNSSGRLNELVDADAGELPLAAALSLVLLASWGVLLVTRGIFRRAVAVLGLVAAVGVVAALLIGWGDAVDGFRDAFRVTGLPSDTSSDVPVERTGWWWTAVAASVIASLASVAAVLRVKHWPEMGQRYDAPTRPEAATPTAEGDLWRAIDEGHDPTA